MHQWSQLWNHANLHTPMLFLHIHCVLLRVIDLLIYYNVLPTPQALRTKLNNLEISFNRGWKAEMIDVYKKSTCGLDFLQWRLHMNENHCKDFFTVLTFNLVKFFFFFLWFDYNFVQHRKSHDNVSNGDMSLWATCCYHKTLLSICYVNIFLQERFIVVLIHQ